jgi:hypothetical protein
MIKAVSGDGNGSEKKRQQELRVELVVRGTTGTARNGAA